MKKILFILTLCAFAFVAPTLTGENQAHAQLRQKTTPVLPQGQFINIGVSPKDTLAVSDTIAYIIPIEHTNKVNFYQTFKWTKIGAGTATMDLQFWQSNNGTDWLTLKQGVNMIAYTKTFTLSATGTNEIDFARDTVTVSARYLKIQYKTSNTSSVQGSVATTVKSYYN